jgi:hypothetical protein
VGYYNKNHSVYQTLTEHWDGTAWSIVSSPNPGATYTTLSGVTCSSSSDCWAVGAYIGSSGANETLIEHWDGTAWSIVSSPNNGRSTTLKGVTCASSSDCWAVGVYYDGDFDHALTEHWNGIAWSIVSSANASGTQNNFLNAVTCASSSNCWAVGYYNSGSIYQTLTEHWDGAAWSIVNSPNPTQYNFLNAVTCASASDCWAVGYHGGIAQTLIEHYSPVVQLNALVSRKVHGNADIFNIYLPLTGTPGIECRAPGHVPGGAADHQIVFTFTNPLSAVGGASIISGTGSVASSYVDGTNANNYIVNLTGVANAKYLTVGLKNVSNSAGDFSSVVSVSMGVLFGDVNATGRTDSGDVTAVRNHTVSVPSDDQTARFDVNASGRIDAGDVTKTRNATVTILP